LRNSFESLAGGNIEACRRIDGHDHGEEQSVSAKPTAGDFERWALPHAGAALRLAQALVRNTADAEDVVQEAFVKAFTHANDFAGDGPGAFRAWLLSIVRNTAFMRLRHGRLQAELFAESDEAFAGHEPQASPEASLLAAADAQAVHRALEALAPEFREVLVLREFEDLTYREISQVVGVPLGTVMSRLWRGRRLLATELQRTTRGGS
jgi:RNA polymerase sigma factor (sigma-70 family)